MKKILTDAQKEQIRSVYKRYDKRYKCFPDFILELMIEDIECYYEESASLREAILAQLANVTIDNEPLSDLITKNIAEKATAELA